MVARESFVILCGVQLGGRGGLGGISGVYNYLMQVCAGGTACCIVSLVVIMVWDKGIGNSALSTLVIGGYSCHR